MLSHTAEYALRALVHLAALPAGKVILGKDLADRAAIPARYLSKILWVLGNAGIIDATRGSGGGYRLRRPARQIRLAEVVDLFDKARARPVCLLGWNPECSDARPCPAHAAWKSVRDAYVRFLETTTIADIAHLPGDLRQGVEGSGPGAGKEGFRGPF
jgi:Rrf2 family protein